MYTDPDNIKTDQNLQNKEKKEKNERKITALLMGKLQVRRETKVEDNKVNQREADSVRAERSSIEDLVLMRTKLLNWSSFSPHLTQKVSFSLFPHA